ncbi:MAG: 4Fe-4S binding protein [Atopobiaceae bacterium]|nr:4Fe-4S binding protein [Atopobiaceae bacterium]
MAVQLLSGNEAIAQAAWEAGCALGVGYPGTPSTETLENLVLKEDCHCEWSPNEKVALEVGIGASLGGLRSLVTMKHVGLNVAADPLMSVCNAGVNGGLVILAADDPSCHSSQNEQDSRVYADFARILCLDPSDSAEAYEYTREAFDLSERFDVPVMLHETMRIAHTKSLVELTGERTEVEPKDYVEDISKWVMMPAIAVQRRAAADKRTQELIAYAETSPLNRIEMRDSSLGIICAGAVYEHVREALPEASTLKLGITWPLAPELLKSFASQVDRCIVVEEASDYLSLRVKAYGIQLDSPDVSPLPIAGELSPARIRTAFGKEMPESIDVATDLPPRPPALCPGCPHRFVFTELKRMKAIVMGDIGCYTLGAVAPFRAVHSTIDMGASVSMAHGMELARASERASRPVVAVIGDSTFAHSGITSLLGTIYNAGTGTVLILDNRTTAMTGTQGNPVNGVTLSQQMTQKNPLDHPEGKAVDLIALCQAMGVEDLREVDAQNMKAVRTALSEATKNTSQLSVVIFKSPCQLIDRARGPIPEIVDCRACGQCIQIGCPAIYKDETGRAVIDSSQCVGCGQCAQTCPFGCIS